MDPTEEPENEDSMLMDNFPHPHQPYQGDAHNYSWKDEKESARFYRPDSRDTHLSQPPSVRNSFNASNSLSKSRHESEERHFASNSASFYEEDSNQRAKSEDRAAGGQQPLTYAWGRNHHGELGLSAVETTASPSQPRGLKCQVQFVATARSHTVVLSTQGQLLVAGSSLFGKTGQASTVSCMRTFRIVKGIADQVIEKVACGDYHTLALTKEGVLYSWGGHLWDKTGHKTEGIHRLERLKHHTIVDVAAGDYHSVALSSRGEVFSWGGGGEDKNHGQLGHSNRKEVPQPELIEFFRGKPALKIACGNYFTMIMTQAREVFAFGDGTYGQLGTGGRDECSEPRRVLLNYSQTTEEFFANDADIWVEQMGLGARHSLLLTNRGTLYVCGYNSQGQLGLGHHKNVFEPTLVRSLLTKPLSMVAAGHSHSLALTCRHDVYSCGYNKYGQLGLKEDGKHVTVWSHVAELARQRVGRIYAGADHSWAVIDSLNPMVLDYEPPSPIRAPMEDPTKDSRKGEDSRSVANSLESMVLDLGTARRLELILSELDLSHRLIHCVFKERLKNPRKQLEEYVKAVAEMEKDKLRCHKLTNDSEVYDGQGQVAMAAHPRGFTVMLVCEIGEDADEYQQLPTHTTLPIGAMYLMTATTLKVNNKVPPHNRWFFKFLEMFDEHLEHVRFVELRPSRL